MDRKHKITVGSGLRRIVTPMLLGALVCPCALYLLGFFDPRPGDLIGFGPEFAAVFFGVPLGLFLGSVVGWLWLVVAVGRESSE